MKKVSDFTFQVGPPGPDDLKRNVEGWYNNAGKPASELWIDYVHDILGQFAQRKPDQTSSMVQRICASSLCLNIGL